MISKTPSSSHLPSPLRMSSPPSSSSPSLYLLQTEINKVLSKGLPVEVWKMPRGKRAIVATQTMLNVAHEFVDLNSRDPEDVVKKQWLVRHLLSSHLSLQQMKQAHELLQNATERYGLAPSARFYDRFTKYFAVRGEREWVHSSHSVNCHHRNLHPLCPALTPIVCIASPFLGRSHRQVQRYFTEDGQPRCIMSCLTSSSCFLLL